jgi:hypothetical protein
MGLTLLPLPISAAVPAAKAFAIYLDRLKKEGKMSIARAPLPDFFIGAHAEAYRSPHAILIEFARISLE